MFARQGMVSTLVLKPYSLNVILMDIQDFLKVTQFIVTVPRFDAFHHDLPHLQALVICPVKEALR